MPEVHSRLAATPDPAPNPGLPDRFRITLKRAAGALASVAAVGAVLGGLAGYLNTWSALRSHFFRVENAAAPQAEAPIVSKGPTVAVAPFTNETGEASLQTFVIGLRRATVADLGKFGQLRVLAPHNETLSNDALRQLGADYVIEGDVMRNAGAIGAALRLVNVSTGAQVWSKTFDAKSGGDDHGPAQEEIAGRAAAIIGSWSGQIAFDGYTSILAKPLAAVTPYECIVQGVMVSQRPLPESYVRARSCLEALVAKDPNNADAWGALAAVYNGQRFFGTGLPADEAASIARRSYLGERVFASAARAVTLAPNSSFAHRTLAFAYAGQCDRDRLWAETRKALELNPNDPMNYGVLGNTIATLGEWEAGGAMVQTGIDMLGADSPRYWWQAIAGRHLARGEFQQAYQAALKAYYEQNVQSSLFMAGVLMAIGRTDAANAEIAKILKMKPDFRLREADAWWRAICVRDERRELWMGWLRKAGLPE